MAARLIRLGLIPAIMMGGLLGSLAAGRIGELPTRSRWRQHDIHRPRPAVVEPAGGRAVAPSPALKDAVVLFDGTSLGAWETPKGRPAGWILKDGFLEVVPGTGPIQTRGKFGDVQLHVEWASPDPPSGTGQDPGNSGIFLMGQFELQVLDS
jgi:hypothetical protein